MPRKRHRGRQTHRARTRMAPILTTAVLSGAVRAVLDWLLQYLDHLLNLV